VQAILASGTTTFRPTLDPREKRPATYFECTVDWSTLGADSVRLKRSAQRIWFDGSLAYTSNATIEMIQDRRRARSSRPRSGASRPISRSRLQAGEPDQVPSVLSDARVTSPQSIRNRERSWSRE
jgi:hypothetical protein